MHNTASRSIYIVCVCVSACVCVCVCVFVCVCVCVTGDISMKHQAVVTLCEPLSHTAQSPFRYPLHNLYTRLSITHMHHLKVPVHVIVSWERYFLSII